MSKYWRLEIGQMIIKSLTIASSSCQESFETQWTNFVRFTKIDSIGQGTWIGNCHLDKLNCAQNSILAHGTSLFALATRCVCSWCSITNMRSLGIKWFSKSESRPKNCKHIWSRWFKWSWSQSNQLIRGCWWRIAWLSTWISNRTCCVTRLEFCNRRQRSKRVTLVQMIKWMLIVSTRSTQILLKWWRRRSELSWLIWWLRRLSCSRVASGLTQCRFGRGLKIWFPDSSLREMIIIVNCLSILLEQSDTGI